MFTIFHSRNQSVSAIQEDEGKVKYANPVRISPTRDNINTSHCLGEVVGARLVGIAVKVLQIGELDLKMHTFFAETDIYLDWIPTKQEVLDYAEGREMDFDPPDAIKFKNAVDLEYRKPWTDKQLYFMER